MENKDTNTDYQKVIRRANVRNYRNCNQNHFFLCIKACVRAIFYQIFICSPNDGSTKTTKNVFYFI